MEERGQGGEEVVDGICVDDDGGVIIIRNGWATRGGSSGKIIRVTK